MKENRPQSGVITLGGEVLSDFTTEGLMKKITRITHDSYIFKGTVRENLAMGCETASEPEMREALGQVDLLGFVEENGGLDMEILEKGANLSGGQKQRLALARALLHDSPVYILMKPLPTSMWKAKIKSWKLYRIWHVKSLLF